MTCDVLADARDAVWFSDEKLRATVKKGRTLRLTMGFSGDNGRTMDETQAFVFT